MFLSIRLRAHSKAQSLLEYSIYLSIIIVAAISVQTYIKRGISGVVKDAVDEVGLQNDSWGTVEEDARDISPEPIHTYTDSQGSSDVSFGGARRKDMSSNTFTNGTGIYVSETEE